MAEAAPGSPPVPVLEARGLVRSYEDRGGAWGRKRAGVRAVDGVSLSLGRGESRGLVGESGAGKSTLARLLAALEPPDEGEVLYRGRPILAAPSRERRRLRRRVQIVFQDPAASLDPLQRIGDAVEEPLVIHQLRAGERREARINELLEAVGLPTADEFLQRRPHELSGGERQRVVLARALACEPDALLLDEPVAALDASVQGQVLNLLIGLRERYRLTMFLIAHDLSVVASFCDRIAVMLAGRIVEEGTTDAVLSQPLHPYTAALLAAPAAGGSDEPVEYKVGGCPCRSWCPRAAKTCRTRPELTAQGAGCSVACYFPGGN